MHVAAGALEDAATHLEDAEVAEMGSVLQLLLRSQALWTSPQCRAVQTAMVALQPLACGGALAVELKAAAREQRELTNPASIGNCAGEAVRARCLDRLRELKEAEDEAGMRALEQLQLVLAEVERTWWDSLPETDKEHQARDGWTGWRGGRSGWVDGVEGWTGWRGGRGGRVGR